MAIVRVKEHPNDRELETEVFGNTSGKVKKQAVRRFYVLTDTDTDEQSNIESDPLFSDTIPNYLDTYKSYNDEREDTSMVLIRRTMKVVDDCPTLWIVHCYYGPNYSLKDEPADISMGFRQTSKPYSQAISYLNPSDANYNRRIVDIVNSAGDPFDPPVEEEISESVWRIVRYEDYGVETENRIHLYQDSVNLIDFRSLPSLSGRLNIGADRTLFNGTYYYRVSYEIAHKREGWVRNIQNRGYRSKNAAGIVVNYIDPITASRPAGPIFLDDMGFKSNIPTYKQYLLLQVRDWSELNLDAAF